MFRKSILGVVFIATLFLFLVIHKAAYATNPLSYITQTTMDDTVDIDGKTYLRNYKVTTTPVSECNSPANHYCPQGRYPNLKAEGSKIRTYSRCKYDVACSEGPACTPRCGWPDLEGCDYADAHTCADGFSPVAVNSDREAWCVKLAPAVTYVEVMKVQCPGVTIPVRIAGSKTSASPLKIQKSDGVYGVEYVPVGDANGSCVHIKLPTLGEKVLRKCNPAVTATCA